MLFTIASLAGPAFAKDVTLSWIPSEADGVAGYMVYIARAKSGPVVASPIDLGLVLPDATGVASAQLSNVDRTPSLLFIEMTAYDAAGIESARSNRVALNGDGETVAQPIWWEAFESTNPDPRPLDFEDSNRVFSLVTFADGNRAFGVYSPRGSGLTWSRNDAAAIPDGAPYEIEGRMNMSFGPGVAGVAIRAGAGDLSSAYLLGGDSAGVFGLEQLGQPALYCQSSDSTGVRIERNRWFRFRLRYTQPGGLSRVRAKLWRAAELEPSVWQADCWTAIPPSSESGAFALYQEDFGLTYWDELVIRPVTGVLTPIPSP